MNDKQEAQTLADGGLSVEAIAKEFDVSIATVYRWVTTKAVTEAARDERDQLLVDDYVAGELTMGEICKKHDCWSPQIYAALKRHNITPTRTHKDRVSGEEKEQIVAMYKAGYTVKAIQHVVERSSYAIYMALDEAKVPRRMGKILVLPPGVDWETIIDDTVLQELTERIEVLTSTKPHPTAPSTSLPSQPSPIIEDIIPNSDT